MNVIQSYIPYKSNKNNVLNKDDIYMMMLSSLLLNKHYNKVTLYTDSLHKKFLEKFDFPYDYNTEVLEEDKCLAYGITKLKAIFSQTEPHIHYDLDCFVIKKPEINEFKSPFVFSHNDLPFCKNIKYFPNAMDIVESSNFEHIYDTYLKFYLENYNELSDFPHDEIKLSDVPNMSFIGVNDVKLFSQAISLTLEVYKKIEDDINKEWLGSAFIEQLVLPTFLKSISEDYKNNINDSTLFGWLFPQIDTIYGLEKKEKQLYTEVDKQKVIKIVNKENINKSNFIRFVGNTYSKKYIDLELDFNNPSHDLSNLEYFHAGGYKNNDEIKFLIIKTIINEFGIEVVEKISKTFLTIYPKTKLSKGEKLYEKYTNSNIFTNFNKKSII